MHGNGFSTTEDQATWLFRHVLGDRAGYLVAFTGRQARLGDAAARHNELSQVIQQSFPYPSSGVAAARHLISEAKRGRDTYYGVHLFRRPGNRRRDNAAPTASCLWLDEDEGYYPETGPEPTATVRSSATRRHLYWRLSQAVSIEWAVAMNRRIAAWADGDAGKAVAASVLRVPGTCNYKRHPQIDPVRLEVTGVDPWEPEVLEQSIPPLLPSGPANNLRAAHPKHDSPLDLLDYLGVRDVAVLSEVPDDGGRKFAIVCPWVTEHSGGDRSGSFVGQFADGALWFYCHHAHCCGRSWRDFKRAARPHHTERIRAIRPGFTGHLEAVVHHG